MTKMFLIKYSNILNNHKSASLKSVLCNFPYTYVPHLKRLIYIIHSYGFEK